MNDWKISEKKYNTERLWQKKEYDMISLINEGLE